MVEGEEVKSVRTNDVPWSVEHLLDASGVLRRFFVAPGSLEDAVAQTTGTFDIVVLLDSTSETIRIVNDRPLFDEAELESLRAALLHLAWWTTNRQALRAATRVGTGISAGVDPAEDRRARMEKLYEAIETNLHSLLNRPLCEHRYRVGPVPVVRARPNPRTLLQRKTRPYQREILDRHVAEVVVESDYAWLRSVVLDELRRFAEERARDVPSSDASIPVGHPSRIWADRREQLRRWQEHPVLVSVARAQPRPPSWVLGQSIPGARIIRAWRDIPVEMQLRLLGRGVGGCGERVVHAPMARESRLYELWLFLEIAIGLQERFGFTLIDQEHWFGGEETSHGWKHAPLRFQWEGVGLDGKELRVSARLEHEPHVKTRDGYVTPDIVLTVEARDRKTLHVLDAKCGERGRRESRVVARDKYLARIDPRPSSVLVALPDSMSELRVFARQHRAQFQHRAIDITQCSSPIHGMAWGHLYARPPRPPAPPLGEFSQPGTLGPLQFLVLALQYHRSELRHVCAQCGTQLGVKDVSHRTVRRGTENLTMFDAHEDRLAGGALLSRDELTYRCPRCATTATPSVWIRSACVNGHVLLKYGRLTPHARHGKSGVDPLGENVECIICGHYKGAGARH